jgi:hypothetical protein
LKSVNGLAATPLYERYAFKHFERITPLRIENAHGTVTFLFENAHSGAFSKRKGVKVDE